MENLIEESEEELQMEGEEDNDSDSEDNEAWPINSKEEKIFWNKVLIPNLIYLPSYCPKCKRNTFSINEAQKVDIINPYFLRCSNKSCRYKSSMRTYSILKFVKRIPASIVYAIIKMFIIEKKCAKDIQKTLKRNIHASPNYNTIKKLLKIIRQCFFEYIKYSYKFKQIVGPPKKNRTVAIDETLIMHEQQKQIWLVGGIDTTTKAIRLDIVPERNSINLKYFIENHIEPGTNISHYSWPGYSFPNDNDSVWTHEVHIHGGGDFGYGAHSTSHIEQFWGQLKSIIKKNYSIFPKTGFVYYVQEAEFRYMISKLEDNKLEKKIWKLFKDVYDLCNFDFMTEEEIIDNNNYDI